MERPGKASLTTKQVTTATNWEEYVGSNPVVLGASSLNRRHWAFFSGGHYWHLVGRGQDPTCTAHSTIHRTVPQQERMFRSQVSTVGWDTLVQSKKVPGDLPMKIGHFEHFSEITMLWSIPENYWFIYSCALPVHTKELRYDSQENDISDIIKDWGKKKKIKRERRALGLRAVIPLCFPRRQQAWLCQERAAVSDSLWSCISKSDDVTWGYGLHNHLILGHSPRFSDERPCQVSYSREATYAKEHMKEVIHSFQMSQGPQTGSNSSEGRPRQNPPGLGLPTPHTLAVSIPPCFSPQHVWTRTLPSGNLPAHSKPSNECCSFTMIK